MSGTNADIAVKVMGWRTIATSNAGKVLWHEDQGTWGNPPAQVTDDPPDPARDRMWDSYVPDFLTDVEADYSVLCRVRETWDGTRITAFARALDDIWRERSGGRDVCIGFPNLNYVTGDWSKSALAALGENP